MACILFIPGMMLQSRLYSSSVSYLVGEFEVAVADITGFDTIAALAASVLANAPAHFALVGMSMGGIVALEMLKRSPERITHLALISTTPNCDRLERRASRELQMLRVKQGHLPEVMREMIDSTYFSVANQSNTTLHKSVAEMGRELGADVFLRQSIALRDRSDATPTLCKIACPTLVLCGREDQLCPVEVQVKTAAAIPNADLAVLSGAGHMATIERPDAVTAALRHLMSRRQ